MNYDSNNEMLKNNESNGKVNCNKNILLSIISLATKEISGVASMCDSFGDGIKRAISNNYTNGVKIVENKDGLDVDVYINVLAGYKVPDIAYKVQENIKNAVSSMLDVQINSINVHVQGVDFTGKEDLLWVEFWQGNIALK